MTDHGPTDATEKQLIQLQSTYQTLLACAGEGIYGLDKDGKTTFINEAGMKILGLRNEDVVDIPLHEFHHHSHADGSHYPRHECPIYKAIQDGEVHHVDNEVFWHTDGTAIPVEYTSTPIWQNGILNGAVVVFRDISQRKELEHQRELAFQEVKALKEQIELERDYLRDEINISSDFGEIIGKSRALVRTMAQVEAVAPTPANVLIHGESGVGKEMIARAIHRISPRKEKPMVKVNCASIPKDLFESEFFGHVRGAFTGAHKDRIGRISLANGGTLFLDEVGEIPMNLQSKLLRVLQEKEFERVGDDKTIRADVRIIAATNRDLQEETKLGRFREDLYYRLSVFPIEVPPLRERKDDITVLAAHLLAKSCREMGREMLGLSKQQLLTLDNHNWPGNIRELKNVIERAVILSKGNKLRLDLALQDVAATSEKKLSANKQPELLTESALRHLEKESMLKALTLSEGKISGPNGAAALIGIKPSTFTYRMKALNIKINKRE
ncbi:sigma-54 interaction domain-containing protein [Mariprofundus ferrooxydans]|uniref:sigma-54 interaction domain-containing protein n=1 Tax=Mariprofundus ferrooxydans TaxID=314344 RepID=UPI001431C437|nr:sigma 54-interacting transcriptional regulator [Mariprofundus ferrooxydans]